jgi:hypothetical protein
MKKLLLILLAALATLLVVSCAKIIQPNNLGDEPFVDMGLSVKWASCNAGADAPQMAGDYYYFSDIHSVNAPTKEQMEELLDNCTRKLAKLGGVKGILLTSKITGNSIFLPVVGWYWKDDPELTGTVESRYWTSTSVDESLSNFLYIDITASKKEHPGGLRMEVQKQKKEYKCPVRPVQ